MVTKRYRRSNVLTYSSVGRFQALQPVNDAVMPACWDRNTSVNSLLPCWSVDGYEKKHCLTFGYTQTAYIAQCGKEFALDNHCGTFIELHRPGMTASTCTSRHNIFVYGLEDDAIISQTRLLSEYPSGYRTSTIPMYYKGDRSKIVCRDEYEVRRKNFIIARGLLFEIHL